MKKLILLTLLLSIPLSTVLANRAPEVLHLDKSHPGRFLISNALQDSTLILKNTGPHLLGELSCDGGVSLKYKGLLRGSSAGQKISLSLAEGQEANLTVPKTVDRCQLTFGGETITLVKDEVAFPFLKELNRREENCQYTKVSGLDGLFVTNDYPMMTCAHEAPDIEILDRSEDGLLGKVEALLGYKPDLSFLRNQDPYAKLDFSQAPKLDAIFVSTLLYRRDFTGTVIGRILRFHAERGTLVNIVGTGYMQDEKDKALLKELAQVKNGNIRIQEYKYLDADKGLKSPGTLLTNYLRDMHVKMFVTLSLSNPENNVLIMGGRNIHDGFHFAQKPDFSKYPEIQQSPEGPYAYWNDLEIKVTSEALAKSVYAHLLKFWNRKVVGQVTAPISKATVEISATEVLNSPVTMMRHFLSLPFNDDHALEKLYVEMIDKAEHTILLSSPYLRPTKAIMDAFKRAIARKVEITVQTRINLAGDTQAWLYEETNKAAINELYQHVKLYEWSEDSILHTKMLLVDNKFAFFGSVNLSRRSFIQDVENGFIVHDPNFVGRLVDVFESYNKKSHLINGKQKRKFWASVFVNLFENQF